MLVLSRKPKETIQIGDDRLTMILLTTGRKARAMNKLSDGAILGLVIMCMLLSIAASTLIALLITDLVRKEGRR